MRRGARAAAEAGELLTFNFSFEAEREWLIDRLIVTPFEHKILTKLSSMRSGSVTYVYDWAEIRIYRYCLVIRSYNDCYFDKH